MRLRCLALIVTVIALGSYAFAEQSYKQQLIDKYGFYETTTGRFAPIYPALAKQIAEDFNITKGVCVDVGGGCGTLSFALAQITDLQFYVLDINPWAVRLCNYLALEKQLTDTVRAVQSDAQDMLFRDNFADLVVSRGSIFFWEDQLAGVKECYRILTPGGVAYIGGGFSRILDPGIRTPLAKWKQRSVDEHKIGGWRPIDDELVERARAAGIQDIHLEKEPIAGWWLVIYKPVEQVIYKPLEQTADE